MKKVVTQSRSQEKGGACEASFAEHLPFTLEKAVSFDSFSVVYSYSFV